MKDILVYRTERYLSSKQKDALQRVLEELHGKIGVPTLIVEGGDQIEIKYDIESLVTAMRAQTETINKLTESIEKLAASNEAMVDMLAQDERIDVSSIDGPAYLDGTL